MMTELSVMMQTITENINTSKISGDRVMHPINNHNFGVNGIAVSFYNGTSVVSGYIISQIGSKQFKVTDGTVVKTLYLAPTLAAATNLGQTANRGYCTMFVASPASGASGAVFTSHYGVDTTSTLAVAGTGYSVGEVLTLAGTGSATVTVATITGSGTGPIKTFTVSAVGTVTTLPSAPVAVTGAGGSGATFNLKFKLLSMTSTGGTGYAVNDTLDFNGMAATTLPTAYIATVAGGAPTGITVTAGGGITTLASTISVNNPLQHVVSIWEKKLMTAEGNYYFWTRDTSAEGSAVVSVFG
jgi:hypothetical protein